MRAALWPLSFGFFRRDSGVYRSGAGIRQALPGRADAL